MTYITIFGTFFFWFTITGTDYSWSKWKYSCFFIWMNMIRSLIIRIMSRLICCWCRVLDGFKLNWARKINLRITRESTLKKFCSIIFLVLLLYFFNFMVDISIKRKFSNDSKKWPNSLNGFRLSNDSGYALPVHRI